MSDDSGHGGPAPKDGDDRLLLSSERADGNEAHVVIQSFCPGALVDTTDKLENVPLSFLTKNTA